jgi:DNA repair protein RadC
MFKKIRKSHDVIFAVGDSRHPRNEPQPSEADGKLTRDVIRTGTLLKIEVLDHVIVGNPNHCSLRELGYFL